MAKYCIKYQDQSGIRNMIIEADSEYQAIKMFELEPPHSRLGKGTLISVIIVKE